MHFHEVGALDAVADVAGVCYALEMLRPDRILVSPVHVGSGTVRCAHGVMPVPAPATANLLADVPMYGRTGQGGTVHAHRGGSARTFRAAFRGYAGDAGERPSASGSERRI